MPAQTVLRARKEDAWCEGELTLAPKLWNPIRGRFFRPKYKYFLLSFRDRAVFCFESNEPQVSVHVFFRVCAVILAFFTFLLSFSSALLISSFSNLTFILTRSRTCFAL